MATESGSVGQVGKGNAGGVSRKPQKADGKKTGCLIPFAIIMGSLKQTVFGDVQETGMGGLAGTAEERPHPVFAGCTNGGKEISSVAQKRGAAFIVANGEAQKLRFGSVCGDGDKKVRGHILKECKNGEDAFTTAKSGGPGEVSGCGVNNVCKKTVQHGRITSTEELGLRMPAAQKAISEKESQEAKVFGAQIEGEVTGKKAQTSGVPLSINEDDKILREGGGEKVLAPEISSAAKLAKGGRVEASSLSNLENENITGNTKLSERGNEITKSVERVLSGERGTASEDRPGVFFEKVVSGTKVQVAENKEGSARSVQGDTPVVEDGESAQEARHAFAKGKGNDSVTRETAFASSSDHGSNRDSELSDKSELPDIGARKQTSPADDGVRTSDFGRILSRSSDDRPTADETVRITPRAIIDQITDGAKSSGGRVRITLNPPELGTLDMDVMVRDNKVHVVLRTENSDVGQMLQSNMESLKSSLQNQGLVADNIHVLSREKTDEGGCGSGNGEAFFGRQGGGNGSEKDRKNENGFLGHVFSLPEEESSSLRDGGHISLLA